jgi:hypothetical protein
MMGDVLLADIESETAVRFTPRAAGAVNRAQLACLPDAKRQHGDYHEQRKLHRSI